MTEENLPPGGTWRKCKEAGCPNRATSKGLCRAHYNSWYHHNVVKKANNTYWADLEGERSRPKVTAPVRPFLYTLDQIASLVSMDERELIGIYLYLEGRSTFPVSTHHIRARNIAPANEKPDWRVIESEFLRWLKVIGYDYVPPGEARH